MKSHLSALVAGTLSALLFWGGFGLPAAAVHAYEAEVIEEVYLYPDADAAEIPQEVIPQVDTVEEFVSDIIEDDPIEKTGFVEEVIIPAKNETISGGVAHATYTDLGTAGYLRQGKDTCTLTSLLMVLRRRAIYDGVAQWEAITQEKGVASSFWNGRLLNNGTYADEANGLKMRFTAKFINGTIEEKKNELKDLLYDHPEGVSLYTFSTSKEHAVLLTKYQNDRFYCMDPGTDYMAQGHEFVVPLSDSTQRGRFGETDDEILKNTLKVWYIAEDNNSGIRTQDETVSVAEIDALSSFIAGVPGDYVSLDSYNFPDPEFREFIRTRYSSIISSTDRMLKSNLAAVGSMDIQNTKISNLKGIEFFPNLYSLTINNNQELKQADLRGNTNLSSLIITENSQLETLLFEGNSKLLSLRLNGGMIKSLNVTDCTSMETLVCLNLPLDSIDLSTNTGLKQLDIRHSRIKSLDLKENRNLVNVNCQNNQIEKIDISKCASLEVLNCFSNKLSSIDVLKNYKLTSLNVQSNMLAALDLRNNEDLKTLYAYSNPLTSVLLPNHTLSVCQYRLTNNDQSGSTKSSSSGGQWVKSGSKWWYKYSNGSYPKRQWKKIEDKWYYFDAKGFMHTGWLKQSGKWYYLGKSTDGVMKTGWQKVSKKWYYFNTEGVMLTGWQKIKNKWYYFDTKGAMKTGWQKDGKNWYYLKNNGSMKTGWLKSGGKWYYLDANGRMLSNTSRKIDGTTYRFNASGLCTNP